MTYTVAELGILMKMQDQVSGPAKKIKQSMEKLVEPQKTLKKWANEVGVSSERLNLIIGKQGYSMDKSGNLSNKFTGKIKNVGSVMKGAYTTTQNTAKGFANLFGTMKGSLSILLPTMFGFQNISKAMKSAVDPALELVGANQLYQQMLAIKYLPTALKQLDAVAELGDEWMNESDSQRESEGDMILAIDKMSEFATYTAQNTMLLGALGDAFPTIELTIFGTGIELTGRTIGSFLGLTGSLATGLSVLADKGSSTAITFGGFEQAVGIKATDAIASLGLNAEDTKTKLEDSTVAGSTFNDMIDIMNPDLVTSSTAFWKLTEKVGTYFTKLMGIPERKKLEIETNIENVILSTGILKQSIDNFKDKTITLTIQSVILGAFLQILNMVKSLGKIALDYLLSGTRQYGGYIPSTGLYEMHAGERVVTAGGGGVNFNPTVNINASISSDMDIRGIANKLNNMWASDLRSSMGR